MLEDIFNCIVFIYITTLVSFLIILFFVDYKEGKYINFKGKWDAGITLKIILVIDFISLFISTNLYIAIYFAKPLLTISNIIWLFIINFVGVIFVIMVVDGIWGKLNEITNSTYHVELILDEKKDFEVCNRIRQRGIFASFLILLFFGMIILLIKEMF